MAALILGLGVGLHFGVPLLRAQPARQAAQPDVFAAAQLGEIRTALELYRHEKGIFPSKLRTLVDDEWIEPPQTRVQGYDVRYRVEQGGQSYDLELEPQP